MSLILNKLIDNGFTIKEILEAAQQLRKEEVIRCDECNKKLGDIKKGVLIIKCKCGAYKNYII